jgi:hypothetical protein
MFEAKKNTLFCDVDILVVFFKIRKVTAEQFYVQCETASQNLKEEQNSEQIKNILLSTHWIGNEAEYIHQLEKLYELLDVAKPAKIGQKLQQSQSFDSEFTYQGL